MLSKYRHPRITWQSPGEITYIEGPCIQPYCWLTDFLGSGTANALRPSESEEVAESIFDAIGEHHEV